MHDQPKLSHQFSRLSLSDYPLDAVLSSSNITKRYLHDLIFYLQELNQMTMATLYPVTLHTKRWVVAGAGFVVVTSPTPHTQKHRVALAYMAVECLKLEGLTH